MDEIRIRPRQPADLAGCVRALASVFAQDRYPTEWPEDPIGFLSPRTTMHAWVAVKDTDSGTDTAVKDSAKDSDKDSDTIVGHVLLAGDVRGRGPGRASVNRLFVTPAARGGRVGYRLLAQARDWADARRLRLELEVVADDLAAISLYERSGWHRVDTVAADWSTKDGVVPLVHRYVLPSRPATA